MKQSVLSFEMGQAVCRMGHPVWSVLKNVLDKYDEQASNEDKGNEIGDEIGVPPHTYNNCCMSSVTCFRLNQYCS